MSPKTTVSSQLSQVTLPSGNLPLETCPISLTDLARVSATSAPLGFHIEAGPGGLWRCGTSLDTPNGDFAAILVAYLDDDGDLAEPVEIYGRGTATEEMIEDALSDLGNLARRMEWDMGDALGGAA